MGRRGIVSSVIAASALAAACGAEGDLLSRADGAVDASTQVVGVHSTNAHAVSAWTYTWELPAEASHLLISVQIGSHCDPPPDPAVASVASVTFAGVALTRAETIVGTPCGTSLTRSELWWLADPPAGPHDVVVTLSTAAPSLHSIAIAVRSAALSTPIRASASTSGAGLNAMLDVDGSAGDTVLSVVGHGGELGAIEGPGAAQRLLLVNNVTSTTTLDNSAASVAVSSGSPTAMSWRFGAYDQWQMIAWSLFP